MKKEQKIKKFIYNDFNIIKKDIFFKFKKIKTKKDFLNLICYFIALIKNYIKNYEKEKKENNNAVEIDIVFLQKCSNIIKKELIGVKFPDYPTALSNKIDFVCDSIEERKNLIEIIGKIASEIMNFYHYAGYYSKNKENKNFFDIFNKVESELGKKFIFKCKNKLKKEKFKEKYIKNILEVIYSNEEEIKEMNFKLKKIKNKSEILDFFLFYKKIIIEKIDYVFDKRIEIDNDSRYIGVEIRFDNFNMFAKEDEGIKDLFNVLEVSLDYFLSEKIINISEYKELKKDILKTTYFFSEFVSHIMIYWMFENVRLEEIRKKWISDWDKIEKVLKIKWKIK